MLASWFLPRTKAVTFQAPPGLEFSLRLPPRESQMLLIGYLSARAVYVVFQAL